jgi:hypothetical protein
MIVGLSGTHGTGKSTIINGVKDMGYPVNQAQLARAAQAALGWEKLSIAQESVENMWALQDAILNAMYDRDRAILDGGFVTMVERTPADVWAYTKMWCDRLDIDTERDPRAIQYKHHCRNMADEYLKILVVPMSKKIPFVAEPNRADLQSRETVADDITEFLLSGMLPMSMILGISKSDRILEAYSHMTLEIIKADHYGKII